jgi:hypothetical protein
MSVLPNFRLLDPSRPEVANLIATVVQAYHAVRQSILGAHPQEPTGEE